MPIQDKKFNFSTSDLALLGFGNYSFQKEQFSIQLSAGNTNTDSNDLSNSAVRTDRTTSNNTDNAWGINHRQIPLALQQNKDYFGLTFFTRPQLNLTDRNCRRERKFTRLLTENNLSVQRIVRCLLDPRLQYDLTYQADKNLSDTTIKQQQITCPLVDQKQSFIPFFSNNLESLSGFPDLRAPTYSAKEGSYKEAYSFIDGPTDDYTEYDVMATFRNILGDPISNLAFYWTHYASKVFEGVMYPYGDFIVNRELDYNTRIYRFLLDPSKRYIQRFCMCGAAYPYALNLGQFYDVDTTKPYNESSRQIQVPFKCLGAIYEDDLIIRSFNDCVSYFHTDMKKDPNMIMSPPDTSKMTKIPVDQLSIFNHRGYPYINPNTYEIEWYVSEEYYSSKMNSFYNFASSMLAGAGVLPNDVSKNNPLLF